MTTFQLPPHSLNQEGKIRTVGFELEYADVDLATGVAMQETLLDSNVESEGAFRFLLPWQGQGKFKLEVDSALLSEGTSKDYLTAVGIETRNLNLEQKIDDIVESLASVLVPCEIVTPPLPMNDIAVIDQIARGLRKRHTRGTGKFLPYSFELYINPEVASFDPGYLLRHIQAFVLLYSWICRDSKVDFTRKLSTYIKPYPADYIERIFSPAYSPDTEALIDDYMDDVGSRNHALDMLPLFAYMDEERVMAKAREPDLIKPRPAFHYRLANSQVDQPQWNVAGGWIYWVEVEKLAHNEEALQGLCHDYLVKNPASVFRSDASWAAHVAKVLQLENHK